mmetsp:Transcript_4624/g.14045  ORF Transcript_4624/g.14045 Transcript_4624/m.14045 type:complete len:214 (-) Transcript_4624:313-954(-)
MGQTRLGAGRVRRADGVRSATHSSWHGVRQGRRRHDALRRRRRESEMFELWHRQTIAVRGQGHRREHHSCDCDDKRDCRRPPGRATRPDSHEIAGRVDRRRDQVHLLPARSNGPNGVSPPAHRPRFAAIDVLRLPLGRRRGRLGYALCDAQGVRRRRPQIKAQFRRARPRRRRVGHLRRRRRPTQRKSSSHPRQAPCRWPRRRRRLQGDRLRD